MLGIRELVTKVKAGDMSAADVVREHAKNIKHSKLNSFIAPTLDQALVQAEALDEKIRRGEGLGPLAGVPLAVKDVLVTQGVQATAGSKILQGYVPPYGATVVERLTQAGAIVVGKTNCDEFAMGTSGENSAFGPTKNPWDTSRVPGGSSSGSAAAVAAQECLVALGTDTGGSVRQPASFCGVVGVKPTYGRASRYGLIAMTSSFDCPGPFARTVEDAAYVLQAMAGHDPHDATSVHTTVPNYVAELPKPIKGLRVGVPKEFFAEGLDLGVKQVVEEAIAKLEELGAKPREVSLPSMAYALAAYYVICPSEVSANLARYDSVRYGAVAEAATLYERYAKTRGRYFGAEAKRRIMLGTYVLSSGYYDAYYRTAQAARARIKQEFAEVFKTVDALATPTAPTVAFPLGSKANDPLALYLQDVYTVPANIAGLPALSLPCGFSENLPVGLQLIAAPFAESTMLRLAYAYEQVTPWHARQPKV